MYYLNSRYYDANIGRFINADGILGIVGDSLSTNIYEYCANNPVMHIDPNGYFVVVRPWFAKIIYESFLKLESDISNFDFGNADENVLFHCNAEYLENECNLIVYESNLDGVNVGDSFNLILYLQ